MTKEDIITIPNPLLKTPSKKIGRIDDDVRLLARDMIEALSDWENSREHEFAAALAAVQVGRPYRMVVVRQNFEDKTDQRFDVLINPEILSYEGEATEDLEGCLSVPDIYAKIARHPHIRVKAKSLDGKSRTIKAEGFMARVLQHEIDHTNGIIILDRAQDASKLYSLDNDGNFIPLRTT